MNTYSVEDVDLSGDNYFLVINLGHRNTFEREDVDAKPAHYDIFKGWRGDNTYISSTVDVDYDESNLQATS